MLNPSKLYSFEKKLFAAFSIIILSAIFIFYVLSKNNADFIDTSRWVEHTKDVLQGAEKIRYHIKEIENESRTYVITGKAEEISAFNDVIIQVEERIRFLKKLTADNQSQQVRLDSLMLIVEKRIVFANALMKERQLNGFGAAKTLLEMGTGFALTKKIEALVNAFQEEENRLLELRKRRNQESIDTSYNLIRIFQAGTILLLIAVLIIILSTLKARRLSQQALSENREWFSKTLSGIGDAVIATDKNGIITFINPVGERLTGWASPEAVGKPLDFIFELINEDTRQIVENPVKKVLREKNIIDLAANTKLVRKDKTEVAIDDSAAPIYNSSNELIGVVLVFRDVEKQRTAEKELKQSNERFNKIISISPVALGICTAADRKFLYVNESFEKIVALQKESIIGKTAPEIGIQSTEEKSRILNTVLAEEGRVKGIELQINSSSGEVKDILVSIESLEMDGQDCILFATVDITERRKIESEVQQNNIFLNTVLENIPDMIFVKDAKELRFLRFNKAGEELLGYSKSDLLGKNDYDFFPKEQAGFFIEKDQETLREGKLLDIPQEEIDSKDKGRRWLHTKKIPVADANGQPLYLVGISEDITDRKRHEDAIKELNTHLENNIQQLKYVNKELESFSYSVSHDLRAPLRSIDGYTKILMEDYGAKIDDEGKRIMNVIMGNARKMGQLIDDLLAFSRISKQNLTLIPLDMNSLVYAVITDIRQQQPDLKCSIRANPLPELHADVGMMRIVLTNLIWNAIKYSGKKEHPEIEIGTFKKDNENVFYVKDNGAGFDMQYYSKLFGIFQRLHGNSEFEGTGVGLAIVQRIIMRHGGSVWAEGKVDEGATFFFSIPKKQPPI